MRPTARLGGLVLAIVLGSMLMSPPSYAVKSLTVSCNAEGGSVSFPSGTGEVAVVITLDSGGPFESSVLVSPKRADIVQIFNGTSSAFVSIDASALSKAGKVLASGTAIC